MALDWNEGISSAQSYNEVGSATPDAAEHDAAPVGPTRFQNPRGLTEEARQVQVEMEGTRWLQAETERARRLQAGNLQEVCRDSGAKGAPLIRRLAGQYASVAH